MKVVNILLLSLMAIAIIGLASADTSPNGPGQPGAPGTTCGSPGITNTPGSSITATGSVFNPNGISGTVYAGNPGTASLEHANSSHAISQYDIACFQVSQSNP